MALVITANLGLETEEPLHYADTDGDRVASVLIELGGTAPSDVFRVRAATVDGIADAIRAAVLRASELERDGRDAELVVYFTGHAGTDGLHLDGEVLSLAELKMATRVVPAARRVFVVDACQAGQLLRSKGATLVRVTDTPELFDPPSDEAWIASTGPEERAFEVDQRRGALFTHFFVSGARGAADLDGDHKVTLGELYAFVHRQTTSTAAELGYIQQPQWAGELSRLELTDLDDASAGIEAVGPISEPLLVVRRDTAEVQAELPRGAGGRLALPAGSYQLLAIARARPRVADVVVREGAYRRVVVADDLAEVRGVRTKGGLVERSPGRLAGGYSLGLGATPARADSHGGWLTIAVATGRGHHVTGGAVAAAAPFHTDRLEGSDLSLSGLVRYGYDATAVLRPGVELQVGALQQTARRTPDDVWGTWFGDATGETSTQVAIATTTAGAELRLPAGPITATAWLGAGVAAFGSTPARVTPTGQARLGLEVRL